MNPVTDVNDVREINEATDLQICKHLWPQSANLSVDKFSFMVKKWIK